MAGVTAGNTIVAFLCSGSDAAPASSAVSDADGAYTGGGSAADVGFGVWVRAFYRLNASAGTHTLVGELPSGTATFLVALEIGAPPERRLPGRQRVERGRPRNWH